MVNRAPSRTNNGLSGVNIFKQAIRVDPTPINSTVDTLSFNTLFTNAFENTPNIKNKASMPCKKYDSCKSLTPNLSVAKNYKIRQESSNDNYPTSNDLT